MLDLVTGEEPDARLDHAVLVVPDLDRAEARLAAIGLPVRGGGRHDGHGTVNRLIPLRRGYLEIISVDDPGAARRSPIGSDVLRALEVRGGGLAGFAVEPRATDAGRALADGLAVGAPLVVSRTGPDGVATGWRMRFAPGQAMTGAHPFLLTWDAGPPAPADGPGPTGIDGLAGVRVAPGGADAWYRDVLAPALGGSVAPAAGAGPPAGTALAAVHLSAAAPATVRGAAAAAGIPVDGDDLVLPPDEFGPGARLRVVAPIAPSTHP
nr:VOC family protein [Patulibacter sp. SYSU D01012]